MNHDRSASLPTREPLYAFGEPTATQSSVLRLLSEQVAMPTDQVAMFLAVDVAAAKQLVGTCESHGWVHGGDFAGERDMWWWLRAGGVPWAGTGFGYELPASTSLEHHRGVNEARFQLECAFPDGEWLCERGIRRRNVAKPIPDGVFRIGNAEWAIEVELTAKNAKRIRAKVDALLHAYEKIHFYCSQTTIRQLERVQAACGENRLVVARSSVGSHRFGGLNASGRIEGNYEPTVREAEALRLISEEGSVSPAHLGLLMDFDASTGPGLIEDLLDARALRTGYGNGIDDGWVWCNYRGERVANLGLYPLRGDLRASRFMERDAVTSLRLRLRDRLPAGNWVSRRVLHRGNTRKAGLPVGLVDIEGQRRAVELMTGRWCRERIVKRIETHRHRYSGAIVACSHHLYPFMRALTTEQKWTDVDVERLDGY